MERIALRSLAAGLARLRPRCRPGGRRRRAQPAALACLLSLAACARPEAGAPYRFVESEPEALLESAELYTRETVYEEALTGDEYRDWPGPNRPLFQREAAFEAAEVQEVEISLRGAASGQVKLFWHPPGEPYSEARQITLQAEHVAEAEGAKRFVFAAVSHPEWRGTIAGVRIYTAREDRERLRPTGVRLVHRRLDAETLAAAVARPWRASLGEDLRSVLLAPPGIALERGLRLPEGAVLAFGYGLERGVSQPVSFRVHLVGAGGGEAGGGAASGGEAGEERLLFEDRLTAADAGAWREGRIELPGNAGEEVRLRLETVSETAGETGFDLSAGFPLWAHPEVFPGERREAPMNVMLISIDTLRADHLSLYGYERRTSPELDAWAGRRAAVFRHAVAQAPSTLPSHTSLFTGLDAFRHGANHLPAPPALTTLAERLRRAGYATLARTGGGYLHPRYGLYQGFDVYRYWLFGHDRDREWADGLEAALGWLESYRERPFFLFLHTYEVHGPYRVRQPFYDRLTGGAEEPPEGLLWLVGDPPEAEEGFRATRPPVYRLRAEEPGEEAGAKPAETAGPERAIDLYDSSIAYVDQGLGRLFARLEELGLDERTIVVVTSDHGEAFGEQGMAGHGYLYDNNLLVPLVVAIPGRGGAGETIAEQVRSIDVLPTLLDALGLEPEAGIDGVSLLPLLEGQAGEVPPEAWAYAANDNHGLALRVRNRFKYLFNDTAWEPVYGREELYLLDEDPGEGADVAAGDERAARLRERLAGELDARGSGLFLRLANATEHTLRGTLGGAPVGPTMVKSTDMPCRCVEWRGGALAFEVPPGSAYHLRFEGGPRGRATLAWRLEGSGGAVVTSYEGELDLGDLGPGVVIGLEDGDWRHRRSETPGEVETGLAAWWRGEAAGVEAPSYETEPELMQQLRALGYVQ